MLQLNKYWSVLLLLIFALPLFFLNIHTTHSAGGDDYALYINEAKNIAAGKPFYQTSYVFNQYNNCYSPPQYPPGFPLLLTPIVKIWGIDILPMCYFNTVIAVLLLFSFFVYFSRHMGRTAAICFAIVITYSQFMIKLKEAVLSDASCLLFVMLYLILRGGDKKNWQRTTVLILLATFAMLIRTQSVLLIFAEIIVLLYTLIKKWRSDRALPIREMATSVPVMVITGCLTITLLLKRYVFYSPGVASGFYIDFLMDTLHQKGIVSIVRDNVNFFLECIKTFFHYDTENSGRTAIVTLMESSGLVLCLTGFLMSISKKLTFDDIFFILVCGMMLYYPIHDARYFLPAIAIMFLYSYVALRKIIPAVTRVSPRYIGITLTAIYLFSALPFLKAATTQPANYVPQANDIQAFAYLRQHIKDNELMICARPRLLALYTGRRSIIHAWQYPMAENKRIFDSLNAKYLLQMDGFVNDYYQQFLNFYQHPVDSIDIASGYRIYILR